MENKVVLGFEGVSGQNKHLKSIFFFFFCRRYIEILAHPIPWSTANDAIESEFM